MRVRGIVVRGIVAFQLTHVCADMQLQHVQGVAHGDLADPYQRLRDTFKCGWVTAIYLEWFVALWMHLTHGFWSAFHTLGWNNNIWISRLKVISYIVATIICLVFVAVAVVSCLKGNGIIM